MKLMCVCACLLINVRIVRQKPIIYNIFFLYGVNVEYAARHSLLLLVYQDHKIDYTHKNK